VPQSSVSEVHGLAVGCQFLDLNRGGIGGVDEEEDPLPVPLSLLGEWNEVVPTEVGIDGQSVRLERDDRIAKRCG
jgi:hypothetical protein